MSTQSRLLEVRIRADGKMEKDARKEKAICSFRGEKTYAQMREVSIEEKDVDGGTFDDRAIISGEIRTIIGQSRGQTTGIQIKILKMELLRGQRKRQ